MSDSILRDKSKVFAKDIVFLCRKLKQNGAETVLINQLLRCGTSVGANIHEAQYAHSKKDFIAKLEIALKEANETSYWLKLMHETKRIDDTSYQQTEKLCGNILMLVLFPLLFMAERLCLCLKNMLFPKRIILIFR